MAIKAGLVGLPNVGKSTLFNALTKSEIAAQNFPFCTIDPNVAIAAVPDKRLDHLAEIFSSEKKIPSAVNFVDIAGLVKGASTGEGLGNKFLSHIMEVDLIIHVVRCFEDEEIVHVHNKVDPSADLNIITSELLIKDLESLEKREPKIALGLKKTKDSAAKSLLSIEQELTIEAKIAVEEADLDKIREIVEKGKKRGCNLVPLLSSKKNLIVANISEEDFTTKAYEEFPFYKDLINKFGQSNVIPVSAKIEEELSQLSDQEQLQMRKELDMGQSGLSGLISASFRELDLISFFTCGPKEAHSWQVKKGSTGPQAAGEIHSDLERGFICADVYNYRDISELGDEQAVKTAGKFRTEGKEYIVENGDIINVKFNV